MTTLSGRISKIVRCVKEQGGFAREEWPLGTSGGKPCRIIGGFNLGFENIILAVMWHVVNCIVKSEATEKN